MTDLLDYDEDELLEMAADPDTSISRLMKLLDTETFDEEIAETAHETLLDKISGNELSEKQLYKLATLDAGYDLAGMAEAILRSANCSLRVMEALRNQGDDFIDAALARTSEVPEEWLREFADYVKDTDVREAAEENLRRLENDKAVA